MAQRRDGPGAAQGAVFGAVAAPGENTVTSGVFSGVPAGGCRKSARTLRQLEYSDPG